MTVKDLLEGIAVNAATTEMQRNAISAASRFVCEPSEVIIRHDLSTSQKFRFNVLRIEREGDKMVFVTNGIQLENPHDPKST